MQGELRQLNVLAKTHGGYPSQNDLQVLSPQLRGNYEIHNVVPVQVSHSGRAECVIQKGGTQKATSTANCHRTDVRHKDGA